MKYVKFSCCIYITQSRSALYSSARCSLVLHLKQCGSLGFFALTKPEASPTSCAVLDLVSTRQPGEQWERISWTSYMLFTESKLNWRE
jgi:hypothetical protein